MDNPPQNIKPIVSIGMFVYNGASCIRVAIDSILNQTFKEFELIISDNASNDKTEEICREYANKDSRIRYIRQSKNIGAGANLLFVFDQAQGEYYMWAAHDDVRSPEFLECNLRFLRDHPDFVASTSPVKFEDGLPDPVKMGDKSLNQNTVEGRFLGCLETWRGCGRFYSLMRRKPIVESKIIRQQFYIGSDIAFILELTFKGKFNRLEQGYVALGRGGMSGTGNIYKAYRTNLVNWFLPFREMSLEILEMSTTFTFASRVRIVLAILKMNLITSLHQIKTEMKIRLCGNRL